MWHKENVIQECKYIEGTNDEPTPGPTRKNHNEAG